MPRRVAPLIAAILLVSITAGDAPGVARSARSAPRGPWRGALARELPRLYRELNGIDFGHAHLAETLLGAPIPARAESARVTVLKVIARTPSIPPDESLIAPRFTRLVWGLERTFDWTHTFHRSLYDLFASDKVTDKRAAYKKLLASYLSSPDAITSRPLDHHGRLWAFRESKAFRDSFPKFNSQIWAYHWLQAAAYDVQLLGPAKKQRDLMPAILDRYHEYLDRPPVAWRFMPLMAEVAPRFSSEYPEAAAIFDNLHMLHDNVDDILTRRDLYPSGRKQRDAILKVRRIYLARNHKRAGPFAEYLRSPGSTGSPSPGDRPELGGTHAKELHGEIVLHGPGGVGVEAEPLGPRPPSADDVLRARDKR